jgi:hypothetical protein
MKLYPHPTRSNSTAGYILLEVMLAIMLYGMCVVALIRQLGRTSMNAMETQMDSRVLIRLDSKLTEYHKMSNLAEFENQKLPASEKDELGIWTEVEVQKLEGMQTSGQNGGAGQELQQMYKVIVRAFYTVDWKSDPIMVDAEMWRYLPLYRTQGVTTNGTPAGQANPTPTR